MTAECIKRGTCRKKFRLCNLLGHVKICASFDMVISYDQMVFLNAYVRKALLQLKTCCNSMA